MASFTSKLKLKWKMFLRQHPYTYKALIICFMFGLGYVAFTQVQQLHDHLVAKAAFQPYKKEYSAFLVLLILTGPKYFERRDAIRETWLSDLPDNVKTYFVIGTNSMEAHEIGTLQYEHTRYGDLLLLSDLKDSYFNLTAKVLKSFQWLDKHVDFDFVLKADDDTFARIDILHKELLTMPAEKTYWGFFDGRARVKRSGQWEEKNFVLCDRYLPHAKGGGYILSSDLVHFISHNAPLLQIYSSEDVAVGTWLAGLDIKRIHDTRFDTEFTSRGCFNQYIVTHKQDIKSLHELHDNLRKTSRLCSKEVRLRDSYEYNWNVPPSLCCTRNNSKVP